MQKEEDDASNSGVFEIVSEKEYEQRKEGLYEDSSDETPEFEFSPVEEKQNDNMTNPYENVEVKDDDDRFVFEIPLLEKSTVAVGAEGVVAHLSAYSIDPNYVTPEERVMKDILSSPDPTISLVMLLRWVLDRFTRQQPNS